ncbi:MAG TPA: DUF3108 domain-containing protein [Stellaceae bacterium]|nr:DUF3108 domain-containing protein [Stellaceae bacterium]
MALSRARGFASWSVATGLALASAAAPALAGLNAPLTLRYEAYAAGLPVLSLDFRVVETAYSYDVTGTVSTAGVLRLLSSYSMRTESRGAVAAEDLRPSVHDTKSGSRGRERLAHLDYTGDGMVAAAVSPPEDPDRPKPSAQQTAGTVDPLTAILAMSRDVALTGQCQSKIAVFDGRRRYDLVLSDDGTERWDKSAGYAYVGIVRRCAVDVVKIAGFSSDRDYSPQTNHGRVWIASPRPDAPPLPLRLDFASDWGPITLKMAVVDPAK